MNFGIGSVDGGFSRSSSSGDNVCEEESGGSGGGGPDEVESPESTTQLPPSPERALAPAPFQSPPGSKGPMLSPNDRNGAGNTSLHLVVAAGSLQGIDLLIQHGADLDARDAQGRSALHIACTASGGPDASEDMVTRLLRAGSNPNLSDDTGSTPLHVAAANGKESCLQALLEGGAVSQLNHAGNTPLHISAVQGHLAVMQRLVLWRPLDDGSDKAASPADRSGSGSGSGGGGGGGGGGQTPGGGGLRGTMSVVAHDTCGRAKKVLDRFLLDSGVPDLQV